MPRLPILLPYGLSSEYQNFQTGGKIPTKQHGPLHFQSSSIFDLAADSYSPVRGLPRLTASVASVARERPCRISKNTKSDLGFQRNKAPPWCKEKLGHPSKRLGPSIPVPKALKDSPVPRHETHTTADVSPGIHLGTSYNSPIKIDSDSDEPVAASRQDLTVPHAPR